MLYSIIIPVYNRPDEIETLLDSIAAQSFREFEVVIVEDGSSRACEDHIHRYRHRVDITYVYQQNTGQGFARNKGISLSKGDFFLFFDSDCVLPKDFLRNLDQAIRDRKLDAYGGPDDASDDFSAWEKAMNFSMTSFWTTGGIRGKMKDKTAYQARGYNMGFSREIYDAIGGFVDANRAEDIEISIRIKKAGFKLELVEEAWVYHKRKSTFTSFVRQSYQFGSNRAFVSSLHPEALQIVHFAPSVFLCFLLLLLISFFAKSFFLVPLTLAFVVWFAAVLISAAFQNGSLQVGVLALLTSVGQLSFYGLGLLVGLFRWRLQKLSA